MKNKDAKFAVEYYKEPNSIEEAVHHVVTYLEAQQGPKSQNWHHNSPQRTVRFDDDDKGDMYDYTQDDFGHKTHDRARSLSPSSKQILRKVNDIPSTNHTTSKPAQGSSESELLQKILTLVEGSNRGPNLGQGHQDQKGKGQANATFKSYNQDRNGQGHFSNQAPTLATGNYTSRGGRPGNHQGQGQMQGQSQGQGRYAAIQCFYCSEIGHIKRNCPVLRAEQAQNHPISGNRNIRPAPLTPYYGPSHLNPNYIDLN